MRNFKVEVLDLAKTDTRQARKWYNHQQAGLGKRFTTDLTGTLRKIARNATSFAIRYKVVRLANFKTFPYAAHFYIDNDHDTVFIITILNSSQHPDTPKDRF